MSRDRMNMVPPAQSAFRSSQSDVDIARFNHALAGLDEETIEPVFHMLVDCSYKWLKGQNINHMSASETAKLTHLLAGLTLGGRTTS